MLSVLRFDQFSSHEAGDTCIGHCTVRLFRTRKGLCNVFWPVPMLQQKRDKNAGILNLKLKG